MSHVRMWSVPFNEVVHSSELKTRWVMSCGWNLACLSTADLFTIWITLQLEKIQVFYICGAHFPWTHTNQISMQVEDEHQYSTGIWRLIESSWFAVDTTLRQHQIMRIPQPCACAFATLAMGSVIRFYLSISGPLDEIWANLLLTFDSCRQLVLFLLIRFFSFSFF